MALPKCPLRQRRRTTPCVSIDALFRSALHKAFFRFSNFVIFWQLRATQAQEAAAEARAQPGERIGVAGSNRRRGEFIERVRIIAAANGGKGRVFNEVRHGNLDVEFDEMREWILGGCSGDPKIPRAQFGHQSARMTMS